MQCTERYWGELMQQNERTDYYRTREQAERLAARNANSDEARRAHEKLAEAYALLITK